MKKHLILQFLLFTFSSIYGQIADGPERLQAIQNALTDWKITDCENQIQGLIAEIAADTNTVFYADVLDLWGQTLEKKGDYPSALVMSERANQKFETLNQPLRVTENAAFRASIYTILNQFGKADSLMQISYLRHAQVGGSSTVEFAKTLYYDGLLKAEERSFVLADSLYGLAKALTVNIDTTSILYARIHYRLGESAMEQNNYDRSEAYLLHSLRLLSEYHGEDHPESSYVWGHLGNLYQQMANVNQAETCYLKAKEILINALGVKNFLYARLLSNLGALYEVRGQYSEAEELYFESTDACPAVMKKSNFYGQLLTSMGDLYLSLGQIEKIEKYYQDAQVVFAETSNSAGFAIVADRLGCFYRDDYQFEKAETVFAGGLAVLDTTNRKHFADFAHLNANLALLYEYQEKFEKAEEKYLEAKDQMREAFGEEHYNYGILLNNIAFFFETMGRYAEALPLYLQAEKIEKADLGERNPDFIYTLTNIARMYALVDSSEAALRYFRQSCQTQIDLIYNHYSTFDETTRLAYLRQAMGEFYQFFSYALNYAGSDSQVYEDLQNINIAIKTLAVDFGINSRQLVASAEDRSITQIYDDWLAARKLFGAIYILSEEEQELASIDLDSLENQIDLLEKRLVRQSDYIADKLVSRPQVTHSDIVGRLEVDEAVVDIVRFRYVPPEYISDSTYYCALLTRKNDPQPKLIHLTSEAEMKKILDDYDWSGSNILNNIQLGNQLYQILWQPLEEHLSGISKIHISPAGLLYKVSFGGLPKGGGYLNHDYQFSYYGNIRELVPSDSVPTEGTSSIALLGGAVFELDSLALEQIAQERRESRPDGIIANTDSTPDEESGGSSSTRSAENEEAASGISSFAYLPGSSQEIQTISEAFVDRNWALKTFSGAEALEENIKALSGADSPQIMHLATHAYFFPRPGKGASSGASLSSRLRVASNPLFRTGLALAGANFAWTSGRRIEGLNDGILTAYEISNLDLSCTDLVVLSACETGLGDIQSEEGVFGLQRAFKLAGVDELIISLWKVPDEQTLELTTAFYEYYLTSGNASEALHRAQLDMSEDYRPFFWAGFILFR